MVSTDLSGTHTHGHVEVWRRQQSSQRGAETSLRIGDEAPSDLHERHASSCGHLGKERGRERQGKSNSRIRGLSFPGRSARLRCVWVNAGASRHRTALRPFPSRAFELLINAGPAAPTGLLLKRGIAPGSVPVSVAGGPARSHQGPRAPVGLREALRCDLVSDECKTGSRR